MHLNGNGLRLLIKVLFLIFLEWLLVLITADSHKRTESRFRGIICIFFCFKQNANYSPEPQLYSFVPAQFETSLFILNERHQNIVSTGKINVYRC